MTTPEDPLDWPCLCGRPFGDHTLRQQQICAQTEGWTLPWEEVPGGQHEDIAVDGIWDSVVIKSMATKTALGCFPVIQLHFASSARPGDVREETLVQDPRHLKDLARLFSVAVDKACVAARRLR